MVLNSKLGPILPHFRDILEILYAESHIYHTQVNPTRIPVKISGCKKFPLESIHNVGANTQANCK